MKCTICGMAVTNWVANQKYPDKIVCMDCLHRLILNIDTLERELEPIADALDKAMDSISRKL